MAPLYPTQIEHVTPDWMTEALRESGVCVKARVVALETVPLSAQGVGFLSGLVRIGLTYDQQESEAPAMVVMKMPAVTDENRQLAEEFRAYLREARFYRDIAPRSRIRTPRCYYAGIDEATGGSVLVMEDLDSYTKGDQVKGLTLEQAQAVIDTIAPFHAQWWNHPELSTLEWMPLENLDIHHLFARNWPEFRFEYYGGLTPEEIAVGDRLNWQGDRLAAKIRDIDRTIVHWDYRADNLFFDEMGKPDPVIVLDWQLLQRGLGAYDIARAVCGSLPTEIQRGRHRDLVARWHRGLLQHGVSDYSFDEAWEDFLTGLLLCLYNPVSFYRLGNKGGPRGRALMNVMIHRFFRAAVELDACAVLGE